MKQNLEQRLQFLKTEFESGQQMLAELATKQENFKTTLLRISGAIQVLEELKAEITEQDSEDIPTPENNGILSPELVEQNN